MKARGENENYNALTGEAPRPQGFRLQQCFLEGARALNPREVRAYRFEDFAGKVVACVCAQLRAWGIS
eukprot:8445680-Alexandrium_andersonii.AAC.1